MLSVTDCVSWCTNLPLIFLVLRPSDLDWNLCHLLASSQTFELRRCLTTISTLVLTDLEVPSLRKRVRFIYVMLVIYNVYWQQYVYYTLGLVKILQRNRRTEMYT